MCSHFLFLSLPLSPCACVSFNLTNPSFPTTLTGLDSCDYFAVCAFNGQQQWFDGGRLHAMSENSMKQAEAWVDTVQPSGLTDILTPYKRAVSILTTQSGAGESDGGNRSGSSGSSGSFGVSAAKVVPMESGSMDDAAALPIIVRIYTCVCVCVCLFFSLSLSLSLSLSHSLTHCPVLPI